MATTNPCFLLVVVVRSTYQRQRRLFSGTDRRDISLSHTLSGCRRESGALTGKEKRDSSNSEREGENQLD